jgi:hypothetical protein
MMVHVDEEPRVETTGFRAWVREWKVEIGLVIALVGVAVVTVAVLIGVAEFIHLIHMIEQPRGSQ